MAGNDSMEGRMRRLEEAQAFDQRAIEELSREVRVLGDRVFQLAAALKRVEELLAESEPDDEDGAGREG